MPTKLMIALKAGRASAWAALKPAFDRAIQMAEEAEHIASHASNQVLANITPAYPPIVLDLARAGDYEGGDEQ